VIGAKFRAACYSIVCEHFAQISFPKRRGRIKLADGFSIQGITDLVPFVLLGEYSTFRPIFHFLFLDNPSFPFKTVRDETPDLQHDKTAIGLYPDGKK